MIGSEFCTRWKQNKLFPYRSSSNKLPWMYPTLCSSISLSALEFKKVRVPVPAKAPGLLWSKSCYSLVCLKIILLPKSLGRHCVYVWGCNTYTYTHMWTFLYICIYMKNKIHNYYIFAFRSHTTHVRTLEQKIFVIQLPQRRYKITHDENSFKILF